MSIHNIFFAVPGDINTLTGGYAYDRRLLAELRRLTLPIQYHGLAGSFPYANDTALADTDSWLSSLPDHSTVLVDGLAYAAMDALATKHGKRLHFCALCHHPLSLETGLKPEIRDKLQQSEKRALAAAAEVIVTSARTKQILTEQFAVPKSRITVALPGTDRHDYARCKGEPLQLLCVATLTPRKAHHILIQALSQVQHLPWQAVFIGGDNFDPDWAAQLRQQVQDLGLAERITFAGAKSNLHADYLYADIFVLPSLFEGYGMVFAEALSYGLPIIAARAGAVPDVVPASAGLLVEPGSVESLSVALQSLLSNGDLRRSLQLGAQAAALKLPAWEQTALTVHKALLRASTW